MTLPGWKCQVPQRFELDRLLGPGTLLGGSYRLVKRIATGGMGSIYLASHTRLPGSLIVKVLESSNAPAEALDQLRHEAVVLARIRHPNIVQLIDFNWTEQGLPYLVMEHLSGKDLGEVLRSRPRLPRDEVRGILRQVAAALYAAHRVGIVHRDLKPQNIMVIPCDGGADLVKVIDFGISMRRLRRGRSAGVTYGVVGTPEFMSPEQAEGQHDIDYTSDVFSLAVIAYVLLTGQSPWQGSAAEDVLASVARCKPRPIPDGLVPRAAEAVLFRGMAKARSLRYPSTLALVRALERALMSEEMLPEVGPVTTNPHAAKLAADARLFSEPNDPMMADDGDNRGNEIEGARTSSSVEMETVELVCVPARAEPKTAGISPRRVRMGYGLRVAMAIALGLAIGTAAGMADFRRVASVAGSVWESRVVRSVRDWGTHTMRQSWQEGRAWVERAYATAARAKRGR